MSRSVDFARSAGDIVEEIYALDQPDKTTAELVRRFGQTRNASVIELDYGDQGKTRNSVVAEANGDYIAFLDGDDLWQMEWLHLAALSAAEASDPTIIWHPEFNFFFEGSTAIFEHVPQDDPRFSPDALRVRNFWDALAFCPRYWHEIVPFPERNLDAGWAFEDWFWNAEVIARGARHAVVKDTVIFKRRRKISQNVAAVRHKALPPASAFWRFDYDRGHSQ